MRFLLSVLFLLVFTSNLFAQPAKNQLSPVRNFAVKALQADFRLLRSALEGVHPSLYWYTPKDTLNAVFDRTLRAIDHPLTEQEFINLLYPVICQIRCGHTQLEHSTAYTQQTNRPKAVKLPFDVFVRGNRAWLLKTGVPDSTVRPGSELLAINQTPMADIIQAGKNSWNGDGFNQTWKEFFLNEYGLFSDVCGDVYGWKGPYSLQVKAADGSLRTVTVPAASPARQAPNRNATVAGKKGVPKQPEAHKQSHLALRFMPDSATALLTANGLGYNDEAFYKEAFQQIERRKLKNVVLDIRRNHGGDARISSNLLSYLADSSYIFLQQIIAKLPDPGQNHFAAYFDPELNASYAATFKPGPKWGNWYTFDLKPELGHLMGYQPVADQYRFRGKVYVLIDGGTFSNGANFAAALKAQCRQAVFIGRETGGTELGCGGGTNNKLTLPNSKIRLLLPWMRLVSASHNPVDGHGLIPDYPVEYDPQALIDHRDLDLEKALQLIQP